LGLQYRVDVIHDDGERELEIGEHFLERMRSWKIKRGKYNNTVIIMHLGKSSFYHAMNVFQKEELYSVFFFIQVGKKNM